MNNLQSAFDLVNSIISELQNEYTPLLTPKDKLELFKEKNGALNKMIETFELEIA